MTTTSSTPTPRFVGPSDIAERYGFKDAETVRKQALHHGMPCHRVARRFLFDPDEVDAWVRSRSLHGKITGSEIIASDTDSCVAAQVSKFAPHDLRRAAELLLSIASAIETAQTAPEGMAVGDSA